MTVKYKPHKDNIVIIAEIGVNHEGSFLQAKRLLELAATTGVDFVKFQSFTPQRYASANDAARLERVTKFSLTAQEFKELAQLAADLNVGFLSTPVTEDWVDILNPLCSAFKIASGDITFKPVIQKAAQTNKHIFMSTGAATLEEIDKAVEWVRTEVGDGLLRDRLTLLHCVSAYPAPLEEANTLSIPYLRDRYKLNVGYSNHVIGMSACLAAVALGASVVEVHFTDQKEGRDFRDHALSFDQKDLKEFVLVAKAIKKSLGVYNKSVQPCESQSIPLMRKGIIAARNIKAGEILSEDDLMFARPATEFRADEITSLIGKKINQDVTYGYLIPRKSIICVE